MLYVQPGSPSKTYEAPTPGSSWANTPSGSYTEAGTPRESSLSYGNQIRLPDYSLGVIKLKKVTPLHIFLFIFTCHCSQCPKPILAVNSRRSTTYDTKFSIPTWYTWWATDDTWRWWFESVVACVR